MSRQATLLPSAAYTTTYTSPDIDTQGFRSVEVTIDITNAGTGSVTVSINRKDWASGKYLLMLASAALIANGTVTLKITPGELAAAANSIAADVLPQTIQIVVTANNANPVTYSLDYELADAT